MKAFVAHQRKTNSTSFRQRVEGSKFTHRINIEVTSPEMNQFVLSIHNFFLVLSLPSPSIEIAPKYFAFHLNGCDLIFYSDCHERLVSIPSKLFKNQIGRVVNYELFIMKKLRLKLWRRSEMKIISFFLEIVDNWRTFGLEVSVLLPAENWFGGSPPLPPPGKKF